MVLTQNKKKKKIISFALDVIEPVHAYGLCVVSSRRDDDEACF